MQRRRPGSSGSSHSGSAGGGHERRPLLSSALVVVLLSHLLLANTFVMPSEAHALTLPEASEASKRLSAGDRHGLRIRPDGGVAAWGDNFYGQSDVPAGLDEVVAVAAGYVHSLALKADGTVTSWGGEGGVSYVPPSVDDAVAVAAGGYHTLIVRAGGTVAAAGDNNFSQCDVPAGLTDVVTVAGGMYHSLALKSDGTVTAWGRNAEGQSTVPPALSNVVAIAAGGLHSLALKSDGTVVAWGRGDEQQCSVPPGLSGVVSIAAGLRHSLALKSDGTVIAWGGVTVEGDDGATTIPTGLTNVVAIAAGGHHSLALQANGAVAGWGLNTWGQSLGIVFVEPTPWSTQIAVDTTFRLGLSGPVSAGPAYGQVTLKDSAGTLVAIDKVVSGDLFTIKPKAALKSNTRYTLVVPAGALQDAWGNLSSSFSGDYTTPDTLPPAITSTDPANGAKGVPLNQVLSIVFDEDLVAGPTFADIALRDSQGVRVPCTVTIGGFRNRTLTVTPTASLEFPKSYRFTIPAGAVQDVAGNQFAGRVIDFSTGLLYKRIAGLNRITTAIEISKDAFTRADTVVIATALNFPDALAAAPLAHAFRAPILLVPATGLPTEVQLEITRLGAKSAIIVGGTPAVSDAVERDLKAKGLAVERVFGADRYATAAAIANRLKIVRGVSGFDKVYVATGESFPDALSAGGVAAADGVPILLARRDALPADTLQAISSLLVKRTVVLGGPSAVSDGVLNKLPSPIRLAGSDRYATGIAIAEYGIREGIVSGVGVYVSTGQNYPDALAVGPAAGSAKQLTILVSSNVPLPQSVASFVSGRAGSFSSIKIVGGTAAVSEAVAEAFKGLAE